MRHARTGAVQTADRVPLEALLEPSAVPAVEPLVYASAVPSVEPVAYVGPVFEPQAQVRVEPKLDPALAPWSWPEAPDLPPTPTLTRAMPTNPTPHRTHARVLPAADLPRRSLPRVRSFRGPSPAERYGLPPTTGPRGPSSQRSRARGPGVGLVAAVLVGGSWIALAGMTGYALSILALVLGSAVGAAMHLFGRPDGEENVFFAVLWSILGAAVGFFAIAVQANMSALGVGVGGAIAGSRWNDIIRGVVTAPLNWLYALLGVAAGLYLVRRPRRG